MSGQGRIRWRGSNGRGLRPLNSALAYYQLNREAVRSGPADLPFASINYSAAGVAYAIYRIACARGVALLARELDDPATAAMPLFEPVRFNVEVSK